MRLFPGHRLVWLLIVIVVLVAVLGAAFNFWQKDQKNWNVPELTWQDLAQVNFVTQEVPQELKKHDGQRVRIPGFMVPLEDQLKSVTEFLLVPYPQACIHMPAPPPNQMVLVRMGAQSDPVPVSFGPIWVVGVISFTATPHQYGESSFVMEASAVLPYP